MDRPKKIIQVLANSCDEWDRQAAQKQLERRLEKLGYEVSLKSTSPAA